VRAMSGTEPYSSLELTRTFLETLCSREFSVAERRQFLNALDLLDTNERHPSLRVHQLRGELTGAWSASASRSLRITFERRPSGIKRLIACTRHYND
jgi:mRNA-degrading endonuclease YafQ of YafQ-DinJ toxin-antitoxin module